jgi:Flp pilus assembly protein CpaB
MAARLRLLDGPYPRLPRPLDALSEGWSRLRPRVRLAVGLLAVVALAVAVSLRIERADRRWGGPPVQVLVAQRDLPVGATELAVELEERPPVAAPATALAEVPDGAVLAFALPAGSVLTRAHVDPRGPALGLPPGSRAVPVPVEQGWGVVGGGRVDVWVLGAEGEPARQVAQGAPVLEVAEDESARTALVGIAEDEVAATTAGLALGRVLLTHAPTVPP